MLQCILVQTQFSPCQEITAASLILSLAGHGEKSTSLSSSVRNLPVEDGLRLVGIPVVLSDRLSSQRHSSGTNTLEAKVSECECILCLRILSPCPQEKHLR